MKQQNSTSCVFIFKVTVWLCLRQSVVWKSKSSDPEQSLFSLQSRSCRGKQSATHWISRVWTAWGWTWQRPWWLTQVCPTPPDILNHCVCINRWAVAAVTWCGEESSGADLDEWTVNCIDWAPPRIAYIHITGWTLTITWLLKMLSFIIHNCLYFACRRNTDSAQNVAHTVTIS